MKNRHLVCGLVAHVDAGKTTLSEALLYTAGAVRRLGRVDHRDAFLDTDVQERERGITIFSKQAMLTWKDLDITFLDTPGHVDFSSEMERTLQVLDCAILVISGSDGVQGHTLTLWRLLQKYQVPVFLFVNKMDQLGCDREKLMENLQNELSEYCVDMEDGNAQDEMALCSEEAMEFYLEDGELPDTLISKLITERKLFPCYFGSALRLSGMEILLNALERFWIQRAYPPEFGAKVYKVTHDAQGVRLTYLKVTGGSLKTRTLLSNRKPEVPEGSVWEEKVNQIRLYSGEKYETVEEIPSGRVCAVTGLTHTRPGQGLGMEPDTQAPELSPVFTYQVLLPTGCDPHTALQKLRILEEEDPQLHVVWTERTREIHVQLMGEVQLEILARLLMDRFGLSVHFGEGSILYLETIENAVEGVGHYEPLRHYAEVHLLLEKGERGSGIQACSVCSEDDLERNWQRLILTHIWEKQHLGVLTGSPITDIKITLIAGRAHLKHTEGGDFRQATYRAIRQGLMQAKSTLLEPWYQLRLELPQDCLGRAMSDIQQMGGSTQPPETHGQECLLTASAPVAKARHYAREVAAYTKGRGHISMSLQGYAPCTNQDAVVEWFGYDPEADLENSPDSIFCSHGAGYPVKWNEVPKYMHINTGILKEKPKQDISSSEPLYRGYSGSSEEDRELMAIFERTYGPIKNRGFQPVARNSETGNPLAHMQQVSLPNEKEYLVVDGYNMIFAWDELKKEAQYSLEAARKSLMDILVNYRGVRNCEIILVFDGYRVSGNQGETENYQNISVVYTKKAQTADSYIEKITHELGKKVRVRVATSDASEQFIILGNGALRVSAGEFHREVEGANAEIRRMLDILNRQVYPDDRMSTAIRNALNRKRES